MKTHIRLKYVYCFEREPVLPSDGRLGPSLPQRIGDNKKRAVIDGLLPFIWGAQYICCKEAPNITFARR